MVTTALCTLLYALRKLKVKNTTPVMPGDIWSATVSKSYGFHMLMSYLDSIGNRMNFQSSTQAGDKKDYDVLFSGCKHIRHLLAIWSASLDYHWCFSRHFCKLWQCSSDRRRQSAAAKLTGKSFTEITLHRSDKVKTIGDENSVSNAGKTLWWTQIFFST